MFNPQPGVGRGECIEPDLEKELYPSVVAAEVSGDSDLFTFQVMISSPYASAERHTDAVRVIGDDGVVYGILELTHPHAGQQPFSRTLRDVEIPESVTKVIIEGRDSTYGWGGEVVTLAIR